MIDFYENRKKSFVSFFGTNMNFQSHLHQQVELIYVESGQLDITIHQTNYEVTTGELAIIFPNTIHRYETKKHNDYGMMIFDIELAGDHANKLTHYECKTPILHSDEIHKDILYCLNALKEQINGDITTGILKGYISIILGRIFEKIQIQKIENNSSSDLTHKMLVYITDNFKEPITIDKVAKSIGASKYYLSRIFSSKIGMSFNTYVNSLRIGQAQHLLQNTNQSILDIAFECGFDSQRTFNRAFNALCGTTPKEYRKKLR